MAGSSALPRNPLEPEVLRDLPPDQPLDFGSDVFPQLLVRGLPLYGQRTQGYVLDIGSPDRYAQAEADWQAGLFRTSVEPASVLAGRGVASC